MTISPIPWRFRLAPVPDREYIVAATTGLGVSWRAWRKVWAFQVATRRIMAQLNAANGCVGFALHATLNPPTGSTISVWETMEQLRHFQTTGAHGAALAQLRSAQPGQFQYLQWKSVGAALPQTWAVVLGRFRPGEL